MAEKNKKKSVKKVSSKFQELVIRVAPSEVVPTVNDIIEPMHEGKKYSIEKTPFTVRQIMSLVAPTPREQVYTRPGKGGQKWSYVTGSYVEKKLNFVFGFLWDFDILSEGQKGDFLFVKGKLTVKLANGTTISKTQYGRSEIKYLKDKSHIDANMLDYGNDLKSAATDSLKKCASLLGIAADIYGKQDYQRETNVVLKEEATVVTEKDAIKGPDNEPVFVCKVCDDIVDTKVANYSKNLYGKVLCREHQATAKRK